jgi:glycolate oxidase FAD binding subunit
MSETFRPGDADQVCETVAWAAAEERPLEIRGAGSKRNLGRPMDNCSVLDLSALSGLTYYEPAELVLAAKAGTPLSVIETELSENGQRLAFEPADYGRILGNAAGQATIGGLVACNLSGPRRIQVGAARDHCLGVSGVSGRGEAFKSGGRVVKNVTGYDLSKLMTGSYGTLAALTEVTFKVLPVPEKTRTVLVFGHGDAEGIATLGQALSSALEPSGLAYLPAVAASRSTVGYVSEIGTSVTAIRVEGPASSVEARCRSLRSLFGGSDKTEELHGHNSGTLWREIADVTLLGSSGGDLWRLSVPPSAASGVVSAVKAELSPSCSAEVLFDWAGGLIWLDVTGAEDAAHEAVRGALHDSGGHATLIRAPGDVRRTVPVFQPPEPGLASLNARVKQGFDPRGILNPGRMGTDY